MPEEYRNIYKRARRARGYTQESAAERLGISVESLRACGTSSRPWRRPRRGRSPSP